ncbi:MAG: right-handed parallel beta-helix repeat-containing protein [Deferrisomatales bacterium]|nr:right-handed parallel beta-helix repeat-containing protein [Deferrisomatales bacterium]
MRGLIWARLGCVVLTLVCLAHTGGGRAHAATSVGGTIAADTSWTLAGSPYVVTSDLTVGANVTLTVEPGVVVKFEVDHRTDIWGQYAYTRRMVVSGTLLAVGTAAEPVVFTSERDDSYGGDTNGDADATAPAPGDWGYIHLTGPGSRLEQAVVRYGGRHDDNTGTGSTSYFRDYLVWVTSAHPELRDSVFEQAYQTAVYVEGTSSPVIAGCTFAAYGSIGVDTYQGIWAPEIRDNIFTGGSYGIRCAGATVVGNQVTGGT